MNRLKIVAISITIFIATLYCSVILFLPSVVEAGLGFSGNFYRQEYRLKPGENSEGIEAYIVVVNTDKATVNIKVKTECPPGVTLELPNTDFTLGTNENKRLDVVVRISQEAKPGKYTLNISANSYTEGTGIKISGGGSQTAKLTVLNPSPNLIPIIGGAAAGVVVLAGAALYAARKLRRQPRNST